MKTNKMATPSHPMWGGSPRSLHIVCSFPSVYSLTLDFWPVQDRHFMLLHGASFHCTPRHVSSLWCWYVKSCGMCSHVLGFLCLCVLMFVYSLMLCVFSCSCVVLMPSCSCPRIHALVFMIRYLLSLLVVSGYPASIVLCFMVLFMYCLSGPLLNPFSVTLCIWVLPSFFTPSHPVTDGAKNKKHPVSSSSVPKPHCLGERSE